MSIKKHMPLLAKHEGEWKGTYVTVDQEGREIDRHASHLTCRFPVDGQVPYHQTNRYSWEDGKEEELDFPATYKDGRIWFDNERIKGSAWEADESTVLLTWERKDIPNAKLFEMINLSDDGQHRSRTWHWFVDNKLIKRTLIEETKVK